MFGLKRKQNNKLWGIFVPLDLISDTFPTNLIALCNSYQDAVSLAKRIAYEEYIFTQFDNLVQTGTIGDNDDPIYSLTFYHLSGTYETQEVQGELWIFPVHIQK